MDDVRIYESVLSSIEVDALFNMPELETPELINPITDIVLNEDDEAQTLVAEISEVFSNPNASNISYEISHDLGEEVSLVLNDGAIQLEELTENFNGSGTVSLVASIADTTITDEFALTINAVNDAPVFSLSDLALNVSINFTENVSISVNPDEVPADETDQVVTYTISPASVAFANVSIDATTGEVSFASIADQIGSQTFTVTANDGETENNLASADFTFSVLDNQTPTIVTLISDASVDEDGSIELSNNLSGVFNDADGDALTFTVTSDTSGVIPNIDGDVLSVTLAENYYGPATLTLTASDGQLEVSDEIIVTVNSINDAPELVNAIADQMATEDGAFSYQFNIASFDDVDGDELSISEITFTNETGENIDWISISESGLISGTPAQTNVGVTTVSITVTDGSLTASDEFTITVENVNDEPEVLEPYTVTLQEDENDFTVDLNTIFSDDDGDALTFQINNEVVGENPILTASISESTLTISLEANAHGTQNVEVRASDAVSSLDYVIVVTVESVNDAPSAVSMDPISLTENGEGMTLDVSTLFIDADEDKLSFGMLDFSASAFTATLDGSTLTITPITDQSGTAEITVTANDSYVTTHNTLSVTVTPINSLPELISSPELALDEDAATETIDLSTVFSDPDGDEMTYSINVDEASSAIFTIALDGNILSVTPNADAFGSGVIQLAAFDEIGAETGTSYDLPVNVMSINDAPVFTLDVTSFELENNFTSTEMIKITMDVPANEAGETITYSISPENSSVANVSIEGLTISITAIVDASGSETFTVTANDGNEVNGTYSQTFEVTVEEADIAITLGLENNSVNVYPNPSSDFIIVKGEANDRFTLINLEGDVVLQGRLNEKTDTSHLSNGIYLVKETMSRVIIKH